MGDKYVVYDPSKKLANPLKKYIHMEWNIDRFLCKSGSSDCIKKKLAAPIVTTKFSNCNHAQAGHEALGEKLKELDEKKRKTSS